MEQLADAMGPFECVNKCGVSCKFTEQVAHSQECLRRLVGCPMRACSSAKFALPFVDMKEHLMCHHNIQCVEGRVVFRWVNPFTASAVHNRILVNGDDAVFVNSHTHSDGQISIRCFSLVKREAVVIMNAQREKRHLRFENVVPILSETNDPKLWFVIENAMGFPPDASTRLTVELKSAVARAGSEGQE